MIAFPRKAHYNAENFSILGFRRNFDVSRSTTTGTIFIHHVQARQRLVQAFEIGYRYAPWSYQSNRY
jgi:hypothetical protein